MNELHDIVDRAIAYADEVRRRMPAYRATAAEGLRRLRDALAERTPDHPALKRLNAFLETLNDGDRA